MSVKAKRWMEGVWDWSGTLEKELGLCLCFFKQKTAYEITT